MNESYLCNNINLIKMKKIILFIYFFIQIVDVLTSKNVQLIDWIKEENLRNKNICQEKGENVNKIIDPLVCLKEKTNDEAFSCCWNALISNEKVEDLKYFTCNNEHSTEIKVLLANCLLHDNHLSDIKEIEKCLPTYSLSFIKLNESKYNKSDQVSSSHFTSVISIESDNHYTNDDIDCSKENEKSDRCSEEKYYQKNIKQICSENQLKNLNKIQTNKLKDLIERKKCLEHKSNDIEFEGLYICWHLVTGEIYPRNDDEWKSFICHGKNNTKSEQLLKIIEECYYEYRSGEYFKLDNPNNYTSKSLNDDVKKCNLSENIFKSDLKALQIHRKAYSLAKKIYLSEKYLHNYCQNTSTSLENILLSNVTCHVNSNEQNVINYVAKFCWKYSLDIKMPTNHDEWKSFFCCHSTEARSKMSTLLDQCYSMTINNVFSQQKQLLVQLSKCAFSLVDPFGQVLLGSE